MVQRDDSAEQDHFWDADPIARSCVDRRDVQRDQDRPASIEFTFTIKLAMPVTHQDGSMTATQIFARDGIWEQPPQLADPSAPSRQQFKSCWGASASM